MRKLLKVCPGFYMDKGIGKSLGFNVHAQETFKALERAGVELDREANIVLHQGPAHLVKPVEGKINVLYTAWEAPNLPEIYVNGASRMDLIVCVSEFAAKAFRKALPDKPVEVVPLGVDVEVFSYKKRHYREPFVYLWVGAPNERKGWKLLQEAWYSFDKRSDVMLVVKTTKPQNGDDVVMSGNVVIDSRKVPKWELAKIYHMCHCFVFPSYAEGFGLPLAEALATGMPAVFTPWGGVLQFADRRTGYPLKYNVVEVDYGVKTVGAEAVVEDLVAKMNFVREHYKTALARGKEGARRIREQFTWEHTAKGLIRLMEQFIYF